MQRQTILADVDAIVEPRGHHVPAGGALNHTQPKDASELEPEVARYSAGCQEEQERQQERDADQAAEVAVRPLPPEDRFEGLKAHAAVGLLILGNLLVFQKR